MSEPLKVGDKLWMVETSYRSGGIGQGREVEIAKIGKKWATMTGRHRPERVNIETMEVDGGQYASPGRCYRSREAHEADKALRAAWSYLIIRLSSNAPPPGVTLAWIDAAHITLGIPKGQL